MGNNGQQKIKIILPHMNWWQFGLITIMIIIAFKSEIKIESLIELIQIIKN